MMSEGKITWWCFEARYRDKDFYVLWEEGVSKNGCALLECIGYRHGAVIATFTNHRYLTPHNIESKLPTILIFS